MNYQEIESKWQEKWAEAKIFEPEVDFTKPKFFVSFPYPYVNGFPHIGHLYTFMRVEAMSRYKQLSGCNVLFPQGWHVTGSPIVLAAKRIEDNEPKQIKILKDMGFSDEEIPKFSNPKHWIDVFVPEFKKDWKRLGVSVDWRREFVTTDLNPHYDAFVQWQMNKLKEKNYVIKGRFPVVWDPKENLAVGDHDRSEGEGETTQEFCLFKFELPDGKLLITATLRPDTLMGITNVYVNPEESYVEIKVKNEIWIVGKPIVKKLSDQDFNPEIIQEHSGKDFLGQKVKSYSGEKILVLPANFLKSEYGTGLVHSVPSDSADDLIALKDLQENTDLLNKYNLDIEEVQSIKPIAVFNTPDYGEFPAETFLEEAGVKNQNEKDKLAKIKKELYKLTFNKAVFNEKYEKGFSKNLKGVLVKHGQEIIKRDLLEKGAIDLFYELTGKVVSRSLTECVVKIVSDQWFVDYANPDWKNITHECLDEMKLYPEKVHTQFNHTIDWLHEWACTREKGLGTKLPWDKKWLVESLTDSTIYMAFYTIAHKVQKIPINQIDDALFDYVFLEKDDSPIKTSKELADDLRKEFEYWMPCDFRNSGKDLIQNHLTFYMFGHTAIFPKKFWPKGIATNGWVTVDGQKMSKSLGNMISLRDMADKFGVDASRLTILSGGEGMDDPNWDSELAKSLDNKFKQIAEFAKTWHNKGVNLERPIDKWLQSQLHNIIKQVTEFMDESLFRSAITKIFFDIPRIAKWYLKRTQEQANKELMKELIEAQIIMLSPFTPHLCEEIWESIGNEGLVSTQEWPLAKEELIDNIADAQEELVNTVLDDMRQVMKLAKIENPKNTSLIIYESWKFDLYNLLSETMKETRNPKEIIGAIMRTDLKKKGQQVTKIIPKVIKSGTPKIILSQLEEMQALEEAKNFFMHESNTNIKIVKAETISDNPKSGQASPGKPAIIVD